MPKPTRSVSRLQKLAAEDMSAEERFYSRSLRIRTGVLDALARQASASNGSAVVWRTLEDLASFCANYVYVSGWDIRPPSSVTCARWIRQFTARNGIFKVALSRFDTFKIAFRTQDSRAQAARILKANRPRKRKK